MKEMLDLVEGCAHGAHADLCRNDIKEISQKIVIAKEEARIAAELADKKAARAQVETERAQLKRSDVADSARALDETRTLVTLKEREKHEATEAATAISSKIQELESEVNTLARQGADRYAAADKANAGMNVFHLPYEET